MKTTGFLPQLSAALLLLCTIASCKKVDIDFGDSTVSDPNIAYIDTISYQLSTIQLDSFITSQTGALMVGRHTDTAFGLMQAETYFHLSTPGVGQIPDGAIYDSARMVLVPSGNYYGDTLAPFTMSAYTLTQDIDLDGKTYFYNPQQFATAPTAIGTTTVHIRPTVKDTILMPVDNSLGANLFRMMRVSSDTLTDDTHFFQYIKGVSIKGASTNQAAYFFKSLDSTVQLRLYYHYSNPDPQTNYATAKYLADNLQFNHVETNRAGTSLQSLTPFTKQRISSIVTGNKSYLQNTGGLQLRIDLPYLRNFRTESVYRKILKAELYIRPYGYITGTMYPLPSTITLYTASDDNLPSSYVVDKNTGNAQTVAPAIDYLYGKDTYYVFNISNYITSIIDGTTENYEGLFLETPTYSTNNAVDRLILANANLYKSVEVRIYRLSL